MKFDHALRCYLEGLQIGVLSSFSWTPMECFEEGRKILGDGEKGNIFEREMVATLGLLLEGRYALVRNIYNLPIEDHNLPVVKQLLKYKQYLIEGYTRSLKELREDPKTVNTFATFSTLIYNYGLKKTVEFYSITDIPTIAEWSGVVVTDDDSNI